MTFTIQLRRDSAANWVTANPILHSGEVGLETDTDKAKMGDGATAWTSLPYWSPNGSTGAVASVFGRTGTVSAQSGDYSVGQVTGAAPLAGPALTGTPTAPTASPLTGNTQVATTAYADSAVSVEKTRALAAEAALVPLSDLPLSIGNGGTGQATASAALNALGGAALNAQNTYTATQYFQPPAGANVVANSFLGRNGGYAYGIDSASPDKPSRDFFLGRLEYTAGGLAASGDTDDFYIQNNAQYTTLSGAVSAGATSLPLTAALTFTGTDGSGNYYVLLGDNTAGNTQETVQITAGRGTTTMTCAPLVNAHPSGALVTVGFDQANQSTFEFFRVGSAFASNKKWRVTIRPDVTTNEPGLGALKIEIPGVGSPTADYMEIASRDESQKVFRVQVDGSITHESVPTDWTDTGCSTTSGSAALTLNTLTPVDAMYGCLVSCAGVPRGAYITAINAGAKTVTLSVNATATATGTLSPLIYKPVFQVRQAVTNGYKPYMSITSGGLIVKNKVALGSGAGSGTNAGGSGNPQYDLVVNGSTIFLDGGNSLGQFALITNSSGNTQLQPWGVTAITMGIVSTSPKLGFFNVTTPVAQPATTGTTTGFVSGGTNAVFANSTFTGNTGSTAYTIGDIVNALKTLGLMAS